MKRLLLCALLFGGACAPLRRTRTDLNLDTARRDTALVRLLRREFDRSFGALEHTVAEFYPPVPANSAAAAETSEAPVPENAAPPPLRGPVRRLVRTTLRLQHDRTATSDSLARTASDTTSRTERHDRADERPSDATRRLQWLALLAAACATLVFALRRR